MAKIPEYIHFRVKAYGLDITVEEANDIEFAPVRHGRWIKPTRVPGSMLDECSVCGFNCGAYTFNYCPNCGARMDGYDAQ